MSSKLKPAVVLKVLGTVPPVRHELADAPSSLDALDDIVLQNLHSSLSGRAYRLLVDGRQAQDEDLVDVGCGRTLVVHVQAVENSSEPRRQPPLSAPVSHSPRAMLREFDGRWISDGVQITVENAMVSWTDGTRTRLHCGIADGTCSMDLDGSTYQGKLVNGGSLLWNDGDTWFRQPQSTADVPLQSARVEQGTPDAVTHAIYASTNEGDMKTEEEPEAEDATDVESEDESNAQSESAASDAVKETCAVPGALEPEEDDAPLSALVDASHISSCQQELKKVSATSSSGDVNIGASRSRSYLEEKASSSREYRGRRCVFKKFVLHCPFGDDRWCVRLLISDSRTINADACQRFFQQVARRVGALPDESHLDAQQKQALDRLSRLEARFTGRGVHVGEAQNALRLFERELVRAHWSKEMFERLRRQMSGEEPLGVEDVPVEISVCWAKPAPGLRRDVWFCTACERVARPLGLACGQSRNAAGWDGNCFVGPLGTAAGAALTAVLLFRFGHLDYDRLTLQPLCRGSGPKPRSRPQFLQGFVDGCLDQQRALVWQQLLSLPAGEAKQFALEQRALGFFDAQSNSDSDEKNALETAKFFSSLFSARAIANVRSGRETATMLARNVSTMRRSKKFNEKESMKTYFWKCRRATALKSTTSGKCYEAGRVAGCKRRAEVDACTQDGRGSRKRRLALEGGA